ncbi:MAG: GNAT family N-acetyltransferase [Patescibacteria group bacterium]
MHWKKEEISVSGIRISINDKEGVEVGRAFLYIMKNDLHQRPFGFMEDVYVKKNARGKGIGKKLIQKVIKTAQEKNCYKLVATSRHSREKVHFMYEKFGFYDQGVEFRMNF